ncbi:hypothetical protein BH11PLA1_BH11PLA1_11060 [soil metagenome]
MSQAGHTAETSLGYQAPSITQFSIFLANKVGKMLALVTGFEDRHVRICAIAVHEASDHAVVRILAGDADAARKILTELEVPFMENEILVVSLDGGRSIAAMCGHLLAAELSIRFTYPLMAWNGAAPTVALAMDDVTMAVQVLRRKEFKLLGEADLPKYGD